MTLRVPSPIRPSASPRSTVTAPAPATPLTVACGSPTAASSYPSPLKSLELRVVVQPSTTAALAGGTASRQLTAASPPIAVRRDGRTTNGLTTTERRNAFTVALL